MSLPGLILCRFIDSPWLSKLHADSSCAQLASISVQYSLCSVVSYYTSLLAFVHFRVALLLLCRETYRITGETLRLACAQHDTA